MVREIVSQKICHSTHLSTALARIRNIILVHGIREARW
jgi:hypothetical protein